MIASEPLLHQPAAQAIAWALLHFVWQGALIAGVTAIALAFMRRSAADVRYVVSTIALAVMLTLPVVTGVQKWQALRDGNPWRPVSAGRSVNTDVLQSTSGRREIARDVAAASQVAAVPQPAAALRAPADGGPSTRFVQVESALPWMLQVWLVGVGVLSLRLLTGWAWLRRLRTHRVVPAAAAWQRLGTRLSRQLHIRRAVTLLDSTLVEVPTVIGWLKPVVLLPVSALGGLTSEQVEAILAHEFAHIRRHDYLVNLLQTLVETLLFYHPAVWWLSHRIRTERENCCDDLAVSLCGDPIAYANALADLETLRGTRMALAATDGSLLHRVRRLVGAPASHAGRGPAWLAGSVTILLVCGIGLAAGASRQQATVAPAVAATAPHPSALPADPVVAHTASTAVAAQPPALAPPPPPAAPQPPSPPLPPRSTEENMAATEAALAAANQRMTETTAALSASEAAQASAAAVLSAAGTSLASVGAALAGAGQSLSESVHNSSGTWVWSNNGEKLAVTYTGTFEFSDDDTDVRQMSSGASLKISDGAWLGRHSVEITERGGTIERRYYVNGSERPFDPEGRQWLRDHLPKFVRNTGIGAEKRVARYLKSGGVSAVLAEIHRIGSNHAKGIYFQQLFAQATLSPEQYRDAMAQASREIDSDYELGTLLISVAERLPNDELSRRAYFDAAATIKSDYELRRVYSTMLKRGPVSASTLASVLEHTSTIESDYELSELLRQILGQQSLDDRSRPLFFKAASGIDSDYEHHRVLTAAIKNADPATVAGALDQGSSIGSNYEAASFLMEVLKQNGVEGALRAPFFRIANRLSSSYEHGRVLQAVVRRSDASHDTLLAALQSAKTLSGYELSQVLLATASTHTLTGDLREAYLDAADTLGRYEQGQVMTALVKSERRK